MSKEEQVTQLTEHMAKFIAHVAKKLPDDVIAKLNDAYEAVKAGKIVPAANFNNITPDSFTW